MLPEHVAIIMDGNGRWATERGEPRLAGHRAGADTVRDLTTHAAELGIRYLTLYAFSSENWLRPDDEVSGLMQLLHDYLREEEPTLRDNGIALRTIGAVWRLPLFVRERLDGVIARTAHLDHMRLTLALSYGSHDEITRAMKAIARRVASGELSPEAIEPETIAAHLDTHDMPDPDLLIRTGGEMRVSNFLLWQVAYTELYVTATPWPAFSRSHLDTALEVYAGRQRRFGMTGDQAEALPPELR